MKDKILILPLYIKILLIFGDRLVLLGILLNIPTLILGLVSIDSEVGIKIEVTNFILPAIVLLGGLLRSLVHINRIETSNIIKRGVFAGEIVLIEPRNSLQQRILFRLSIQVPTSNSKSIVKNYYFLNGSINKNKYDFNFIYDSDKPEKAVLINLFPRLVRQYILKGESTIANKS